MLNGDDLGVLVHNFRMSFNNKTMDELIMEYGSLEVVRLACAKGEENIRMNYLKANTVVHSAGLIAPGGTGGPVTGQTTIE
jgi:hypothetical protein